MRKRGFGAMLGSLLLVLQPGFPSPAPAAIATIRERGIVKVNGLLAPSGTTIYSGNRIATARGAVASITLARGGKLVLSGSTTIHLFAGQAGFTVQIDVGVLGVVSGGEPPVIIQSQGVTIRSRNQQAVYQVTATGKSLEVVALRGVVEAEMAKRTVNIGPGKMMRVAARSHARNSQGSRWKMVLLVAGAGATAGLVATIRTLSSPSSRSCASPSQLGCP